MTSSYDLTSMLVCIAVLTLSSPSAQSTGPSDAPVPPESPERDIEVVGARPDRPDATAPTGSRIGRTDAFTFGTVASGNVAGLSPGSGMDPFAGGTRMVSETLCRSDNPRLSQGAACRLLPIQRLIAASNYDEALSALDRFAADPATDEERYVASALQYQIAAVREEPSDREDALHAMLATAAMPAPIRPAALRTLVSLAIRRGDSAAASARLMELLALVPDDTRSLVNLAALRSEAGQRVEAAALIARAIDVVRQRGEPVPTEWMSFAASGPR